MNELYKKIEDLCNQKNINITKMCADAGVPRGNLTDLKKERQTGLSSKNIGKIASYFGITTDYLLGASDFPYPDLSGQTMRFESVDGQEEKPLTQNGEGLSTEQFKLINEILTELEKCSVSYVQSVHEIVCGNSNRSSGGENAD